MAKPQVITGTLRKLPQRADKALAAASGLSRERVKALMKDGKAMIAGEVVRSPSRMVEAESDFRIAVPAPAAAQAQAEAIPLDIVFEDDALVVVNKPAGMVVHPAAGNPDGTLVNALLHHCAHHGGSGGLSGIGGVARPGIVHRIDKDTSGLLVVAKSDAAHEGLAAQFADHSIHRRYLAICGGHPWPAEQRIEGRIGRSDANRKKMAVLPDTATRGKHAVTHLRVERLLRHAALLECRLETGRTHQVRVHCASIGHALLGDPTYGRTPAPLRSVLKSLGFARQALHAASLGFVHPVTKDRMDFAAPLPQDMQELIDETTR